MCNHLQLAAVFVITLHAAEVGPHDQRGRIHQGLIEGINGIVIHHHGADAVQQTRVFQLGFEKALDLVPGLQRFFQLQLLRLDRRQGFFEFCVAVFHALAGHRHGLFLHELRQVDYRVLQHFSLSRPSAMS